jgi:GGDEF domain-containing protein
MRYKFGDEFLVVLRNKSGKDALDFLSDLRSTLNAELIKIGSTDLAMEFSSGITFFKKDAEQSTIMFELMESLNKAGMLY